MAPPPPMKKAANVTYRPRRKRNCRKAWSIEGKVVLITGANTGIGKATALELALRGARRIIITCRNVAQGNEAAREIAKKVEQTGKPPIEIEVKSLDLSSMDSVCSFAADILASETSIHVLINNAGMLGPSTLTRTADGNELTFATNHLGHFLLTNLLMPLLKRSAPCRIINVTSVDKVIRNYAPEATQLVTNPNFDNDAPYTSFRAYGQSKLANILFTWSLHSRFHRFGVSSFAANPGVVGSDIVRDYPTIIRWLVPYFFPSTATGARTSVHLACEPNMEQFSSQYFSSCSPAEINHWPKEAAEKLWIKSEKLTKKFLK